MIVLSSYALAWFFALGQRLGTWVPGLHGSAGLWEEVGCHDYEKEAGYTGGPQTTHEGQRQNHTYMWTPIE